MNYMDIIKDAMAGIESQGKAADLTSGYQSWKDLLERPAGQSRLRFRRRRPANFRRAGKRRCREYDRGELHRRVGNKATTHDGRRPERCGSAREQLRNRHWIRPGRPDLQRFGANRTWRREQEALTEANIVVEQVDHGCLGLDPLRDKADAVTAQQVGQIRSVNVGRRTALAEQQVRRHLHETHAHIGQIARSHTQIADPIHRETVSE